MIFRSPVITCPDGLCYGDQKLKIESSTRKLLENLVSKLERGKIDTHNTQIHDSS
jgi:hypothetical protein